MSSESSEGEVVCLVGRPAQFISEIGNFDETQCPDFRNPREEYMASMNKLMIFTGMYAAQGVANPQLDTLDQHLPINASSTGHLAGTRSVFATDYAFFAGAAIVELICICLIAPTYHGWWKIGRAVTFSPLEIAKAFEVPVLAHINSNSSAAEIARSCNEQRIQCGSVGDGNNGKQARILSS